MVVLIFYASKDMFSLRAAYFASCFYAINLFPLLLCSVAGKYDVLPAFFALFAVWMAARIKIRLSAVFLSVSTIFKYIAALPLLIILIFLWKKERNQRMIFNYLVIFFIICIAASVPFLLIDAEKFIDSTLLFFLTRKEHGAKSYYHPYYHIPSQFLFLFPLTSLALICIYALRKESISNYDFIMLIFIEISLIVFTNKTLLEQYFFYAIPYLALVFPKILLKEGKVDISSENIASVTAAVILPNLFAYDYLRLFIFVRESSFDHFKISKFLDYHVRYEIIGNVDGRPFIICFILIIYLSLNYILKSQKCKLGNR